MTRSLPTHGRRQEHDGVHVTGEDIEQAIGSVEPLLPDVARVLRDIGAERLRSYVMLGALIFGLLTSGAQALGLV